MSQETPKNGYEPQDDDGLDLEFPGVDTDGLTEEEWAFSFDEDYLTPDADRTGRSSGERYDDLPEEDDGEPDDRELDDGEPEMATSRRPAPEALESIKEMGRRVGGGVRRGMESVRGRMARKARPTEGGSARVRRKGSKALVRPNWVEREPPTIGQDLRGDQMLVYDSELDDIDYTDEEDLPELRDYLPIRFRRYGRSGIGGGILYALFVISVSIILACMAWMFASDVLALNKEVVTKVVEIAPYEPTGDMPTTVTMEVDGEEKEVEITVDIDQVATALKNAGIIEYKWLFKLFSQFSHANTKIDPGTYSVSTELDYRALVSTMQFGSDSQQITRVTFPEGFSMEQIFTLLEESNICRRSELYDAAANYDFDYEFLAELPLGDASRLEGYLFPDTYDFYQGEEAIVSISRFLDNAKNKLSGEVIDRAAERGLTLHEVVTMASLIEKEAGSDDERYNMASVIYNRLNADMPLGLDSTINYIKGTSTFDLTAEDLAIDSPYNTYLYTGLPAGPICNPGMASIEAVLDPPRTDYWYWYSVDGVTEFFTTLDEQQAYAAEHPY